MFILGWVFAFSALAGAEETVAELQKAKLQMSLDVERLSEENKA